MINWKIAILAAASHSFIFIACFGFMFSEGLKASPSAALPVVQWIAGALAIPILMPVFFLTQDLSFVTLTAFAMNSLAWGVAISFLISCIRKLIRQNLPSESMLDNT